MSASVSAAAASAAGLSAAELAAYRRDGLVRPGCRLDPARRAALLALTEQTLQSLPGVRPESINCPHLRGWNPGLPDAVADAWLDLAGLPQLLDRVVDVLGPDVILWGSQLFCKPAGDGLEVPWHQDGGFWPIRPLSTCTVWLAIDDVDAGNGCMRYIPGSHRAAAVVPHRLDEREGLALNQRADEACFDVAAARDDALRAGEFSLHDVYLIHGSNPNRSARRRAGVVWRYMSARSLFDRELGLGDGSRHFRTRFAERPLYLMSGDAGANTTLIDRHPAYRSCAR